MMRDEIIKMVEKAKYIPVPVGERSNLYSDLGFDSLDFVRLLVGIEDVYSITFGLTEMELCLQVDRLIDLVQTKVRERDGHA